MLNHEKSKKNMKTKSKKRRESRKKNVMLLQEKMLNDAPKNTYLINEIVLATIPGFVAWPARIKNMIGETIYVEFFGTGQVYANSYSVNY